MRQGSSTGHYFQTDAEQAQEERRATKASNKNGDPIVLKSKLLAAIPDASASSSLLIAESTGSVRRVDLESGEAKQVYRGPAAPVTCVAVGGPGNRTVFAGSWDKDIWSWDLETKTPGRKYSGHADFVKTVICTKIGPKDCLISGGADKKIIVWDVETGSRIHVIQDQTISMMALQHLVIDPLESTTEAVVLVSASSDPHIRRWRITADTVEQIKEASPNEPNSVRHSILEHDTTVYRLFFDTEGDEVDLWTSSGDGTAKCLSRQKGFTTEDTINHGSHVRAVAVTDQWIITAGRDEDVKVWDRTSGKLYCTLEGHYNEVTDLIILNEGNLVASVSIDGTVRKWPLHKNELDKVNKDREDRANGVVPKEDIPEPNESVMTAEEEAELAALMED
ncbi:WD40-repeat-containing domain protein [Xylaria bambusicola]|uniref:WD40-repeat-containing domain protein n=1 Tax=Xylaria bambusicola TaxID=326684 RepID=UPI0020073EFB|nr:WD40-repeat-containing domain protein [Xylaria bambusicola]KAI0503195.1 WD40-repeat-containing domain protein [Xylaria bambusicola]